MERDASSWLQQSARHGTLFHEDERCLHLKIKGGWGDLWTVLRRCVPDTVSLVFFDAATVTEQELSAQFEQSWFGTTPLFVFASEQDGLVRPLSHAAITFLSHYEGTHQCIVVTPPTQGMSMQCTVQHVQIPDKVDRTLTKQLWKLSDPSLSAEIVEYCAQQVFAKHRDLSLSAACALAKYVGLVGRHAPAWAMEWLPHLVPQQHSLFTLSQHLFARDTVAFYATWVAMRQQYPEEFWLVYWSDQFWNAYHFLLLVPECGAERAATQVKHLPFAFLRSGWRRHSAQVCGEQVQRLAQFDMWYKKGATCIPFETVFAEMLR